MNRTVGVFILLFSFFHTAVFAAYNPAFEAEKGILTGTVTDARSTQKIAGASVMIPDLKLVAVSDSLGNFMFRNLPVGSFLVVVSFEGYKSISKTVQIKVGENTAQFLLEESATEINEVVVTGTSKATQVKRNPVPIVMVNKDYLTTNLNTNAIDAIAKIPGVRAVTTGPNVSKPFIRGLGYNRILTLYDGIRQEGQQWGDEHGIEVDQFAIDRVEVIKGPASLSYGSDALAGVVNLIPTQAAPEGKMIGSISTQYQTNNKMIGGSAMLSATKNGFEWLARISHKQATNYQNSVDGRVFGTAFNETDANAALGLHRKWGYSHIDFVMYDNLQEIPDGSRDSASWKFTRQITEIDTARQIVSNADLNSYSIEPLHQHIQHYRIFTGNNFIFNNGSRLLVNLGFQNSIRREYSHPEVPYQKVPGLYLQLSSYTYDIKYFLKDIDDWSISAGVNGMYQNNTVTNGTEFVVPSYKQFDVGPFITAKKRFNKLDVAGGIRYDVRRFSNDALYTAADPVTGFDRAVASTTAGSKEIFQNYVNTFSGMSGSLGATYNFSEKFSVKANLSRGFRAPNVSEISANGVHPGTNYYQIGNTDFKPEFSLQEDVGFVFSSKFAVIELNLFNNFISNYIYNQKLLGVNGQDSVIAGSGVTQTFKYQASRANLYGGELSVDLHPYKALHFENSLSVVDALNKGIAGQAVPDSERYLPFIPPLHGLSELRYDFDNKHLHIKRGFVKLQMEYYATQNRVYTAYNTETRTPGYTLFNAGIGGGVTNKTGKVFMNVYLMANNIFDLAYWDHLSRLKYFISYPNDPREHGIYNMGRNIALKIDFPLDYKL
ncbi:MAG: TonB-dependent receptor [Bacteroidota bacterium]|nr:TonB-dependent receptor [Bacteroidota bacterium]